MSKAINARVIAVEMGMPVASRVDAHNLAAAMIQAGAEAVLASLWSVDDKATYLLMVRFAQEWFHCMEQEPPAAALARAQTWLRNITNSDLKLWQSKVHKLPAKQPSYLMETLAGQPHFEEGQAPVEEQLLAVRGRIHRFAVDDAKLAIRIAAENADPTARPYADPYYWAGFQVIGW